MIPQHATPQILIGARDLQQHQAQLEERLALPAWQDMVSSDIVWVTNLEEALSIEQVRELQLQLAYPPLGKGRVVIIPFIERASLPAQQALLKLLEEPPTHTQIWLTTAQRASILPTIESRCVVVELPLLGSMPSADTRQWAELYTQLDQAQIADILELSSAYTQRATAETAVDGLLAHLEYLVQEQPSNRQIVTRITTLLHAREMLAQAANPRLVLERTWLAWIQ